MSIEKEIQRRLDVAEMYLKDGAPFTASFRYASLSVLLYREAHKHNNGGEEIDRDTALIRILEQQSQTLSVMDVNRTKKAQEFCQAVCDLFSDDANWSVLDLDGAKEFFAAIGFEPPKEAVEVEE